MSDAPNHHERFHIDCPVTRSNVADGVRAVLGRSVTGIRQIIHGQIDYVYDVKLIDGREVIVKVGPADSEVHQREGWAYEQCLVIGGIPVAATIAIKRLAFADRQWSFSVQEKVAGETLESAFRLGFDLVRLRITVNKAGEILSRIHKIRTRGFGYIKNCGEGTFSSFDELVRERLTRSDEYMMIGREIGLSAADMSRVLEVIEINATLVKAHSPVLNHNDYTPDHIMVDTKGQIVGIIDWGEIQSHSPLNDIAKWDYWWGEVLSTAWLEEGYGEMAKLDGPRELILHWLRLNIGLGALRWYHSRGSRAITNRVKDALVADLDYFR